MGAFFEGISVNGNGEVYTKPDIVEINVRLHGNAELTDDAIIKHRDSRERVQKAFEGLKIDNLKAEEQSLSVKPGNSKDQAQMIIRGNMPATNAPAQVEVSSTMRVRVGNTTQFVAGRLDENDRQVTRHRERCRATVGPSDEEVAQAYRYGRTAGGSLVRFVISNADKIREEAYQKAVDMPNRGPNDWRNCTT